MVYLLDFAAVMATLFSIGGVWWGSVNFLPHLLVMFLMSVWTCWWSSPWSTTAEPAATSPRRSSSLSVSSTSSMPGSSSPSTRPDSPTERVHWAMGSARSSLWYSTAQWEPQCWPWLWWVLLYGYGGSYFTGCHLVILKLLDLIRNDDIMVVNNVLFQVTVNRACMLYFPNKVDKVSPSTELSVRLIIYNICSDFHQQHGDQRSQCSSQQVW